jgi:hypothetical protein
MVKDRSFEYEQDWRLTIQEHFGTAPPQIRALTRLGHTFGNVYGHTSDDTARAAVDGWSGTLGL